MAVSSYNVYSTVSKNGDYRTIEYQYSALPSGETPPPTYVVQNIVTGEDVYTSENKLDATNFAKQLDIGYTIPGHEDPVGVSPNYAPQKYSSNGTPKEVKPPVPPPGASNSSPVSQQDGSSLPKFAQGIIANTTTALNNTLPAHTCSIKLPALFKKIKVEFELFPAVNTKALEDFAQWVSTDLIDPVVEMIKNAVKAIKAKIKEIEVYVNWVKKQIKTLKEWIDAAQELITFMMSLPAKLLQLVTNCLTALQNSMVTMVKNQVKAVTDTTTSTNNAEAGTTAPENIPPDIPGVDETITSIVT